MGIREVVRGGGVRGVSGGVKVGMKGLVKNNCRKKLKAYEIKISLRTS